MKTLYHCGKCGSDLKADDTESLIKKLIKHAKNHGNDLDREEALRKIQEQSDK